MPLSVPSSATVRASSAATGASLTAFTVTATVSLWVEKAEVPPPTPGSTLVPALPQVVSQARKVRASAMVPL